jgi:hypothetical protein
MPSDQLLTKNIGEEFTCVGQWWLPSVSDHSSSEFKRGGTLTFSYKEGLKLEVMGQLETDKSFTDLLGRSVEMIWGVSTEGEFITLFDCQQVGMEIGTVWVESYLVDRVFVSKEAWFVPGEQVKFASLTLQFKNLADWVGSSGFQVPSFNRFDELVKSKKAEITYERPSDLPSINVRGYKVSIKFGNSWPAMGPSMQEATIRQYIVIAVEPRNSQDIAFDDAYVLANGIRNFLCLMIYPNAIYPLVIEGKVKLEEKTAKKEQYATMRLLYRPITTKQLSEKITRRDVIFAYEQVDGIWEAALNKLVVIKNGKLDLAFNKFFAEYFTPTEFTEDEFIAVIIALEDLQRSMRGKDYYLPKQEYKEKLLGVLNQQIDNALLEGKIKKDFQKSLKKRLGYAYQYSLETRLNDLFTTYATEFLSLFVEKTQSAFTRQIVATYHWLMHSNPEFRKDALDGGSELALVNLRLELFVVSMLLLYVGVPSEKIGEMLKLHQFEYLRVSKSAIKNA